MTTIDLHLEPAYAIARRVHLNELPRADGVDILNGEHGINRNSARDLIDAYGRMRAGLVFKRGLSAPFADHFLSRILADDGNDALGLALHALWQQIGYYERVNRVNLRKLRGIAARYDALVPRPDHASAVAGTFEAAVEEALSRGTAERERRLAAAPRIPVRKPVVVLAFERNPDVVAAVLLRAGGVCEGCARPAPFKRKDGRPYLEVHHKIQLANGGEDTVENAQALCPNCHRERHYGA